MRYLDSMLIAPFTWIRNPLLAFWFGSGALAAFAIAIGSATHRLMMLVNGSHLTRAVEDAKRYQDTAIGLLKQGDASNYSGINSLANEAFGKAFFLGVATSCASLWPTFLVAAWIDKRFAGIRLPLGIRDWDMSHLAPLVIATIVLYLIVPRLIKHILRAMKIHRAFRRTARSS